MSLGSAWPPRRLLCHMNSITCSLPARGQQARRSSTSSVIGRYAGLHRELCGAPGEDGPVRGRSTSSARGWGATETDVNPSLRLPMPSSSDLARPQAGVAPGPPSAKVDIRSYQSHLPGHRGTSTLHVGLLAPEEAVRSPVRQPCARETFKMPKVGVIAGCTASPRARSRTPTACVRIVQRRRHRP